MEPSRDRALDYREFPILYVDDEPENLRIFDLTFKREFEILTAANAEAALEILNQRPIVVVLSDQRMPGMTGVEFLTRARELAPRVVRILVTAYGDVDTLQNAINDGAIYRFVSKPWTPEEMRVTLRNGIEMYALERDRGCLIRELTLLSRISNSMNQQLALERLLDLLVNAVVEDLGYDAAGLLFFGPKEGELSWRRLVPKDSAASLALKDLAILSAAAPKFVERLREGECQLLSIADVLTLEGPIKQWATEVAAEEIMVVPLIGKDSVIGALAVDNRRGGERFSARDQTLMEGFATHAVVAIENARMVEDLRRTREQIVRADRLGTLGTMAAGLAHEINNPLVSIHTFLSMAPEKRDDNDGDFWGEYHKLACGEVDRIRRLVETMRGLGRESGDTPLRAELDPSELLREVVKLLARESRRAGVTLRVECDPEVPKISAVRDHLHQVFMNLLLNAIHASPRDGEVQVRSFPDAAAGGVCIEVADNGPGIPEEVLERIFDPFFTTKGPNQGTGLGLMICHRLVSDHQGVISVTTRPGEGATFRVQLPLRGSPEPAAPGPPSA